jgi:hypothetical protein
MKLLAIISAEYGARHVANLRKHGPASWSIETWQAPALFPPVIDYPEDYLPKELPSCDLLLHFGEHRAIAELVPEIAKMTGARPGPAVARLAGGNGHPLRHTKTVMFPD